MNIFRALLAYNNEKNILAVALDAVVSINAAGRITYFNPAAERLFGHSRRKVLGKDMASLLIPPDYQARHREAFAAHLTALSENTAKATPGNILNRRVEMEALRADGTRFPVELRVVRQHKGRKVTFTAFMQDLTDRRQAASANQEIEKRYQQIAEQTGQLVYDYDVVSGRINWSGAIELITGYPPRAFERMEIKDWEQHLHPADRAGALTKLAEAQERCGSYFAEYRFRRKGGDYAEIYDSGTFLPGENGIAARMLGSMRDLSILRDYERRAQQAAENDKLTGLPTRTRFQRLTDYALQRAKEHAGGLCLLMVDMDGFSTINDSLGQAAGDALLYAVSERLNKIAPLVARMGSDEFGILLETGRERAPAFRIMHDIQAALTQEFRLEQLDINTSACVGMSLYPRDGDTATSLINHADTALNRAKREGRNTALLYESSMDDETLQSLVLASDLRRALEQDQLSLHYQPIVKLDSGKVIGMEALARWEHPARGFIPPGQFINVAEETGLIGAVGNWALREACRQMQEWRKAGLTTVRVSVNVSARQLTDSQFISHVDAALNDYALPASALTLELTESLTQSIKQTRSLLNALRQRGIQIAVDDFGTGYSSLNYLARLPIDYLKVDRAFVARLPEDAAQAAITRAIVAMAISLGLGIVAEGIENKNQRDYLRAQDCSEGQGYWYSRPVPVAGMKKILRRGALIGGED